ncbi:MAG: FliM/FliN family flagellar motor C-terminal domain-containing protein [Pseudomonadota bacterium]
MTAAPLENAALKRMLRPGKPAPTGARMFEAKAWRQSLPRVSENAISLVASVIGYDVNKTDLEGILGDWEDYALSILLRGSEEARGLVQLDETLRTGLVEVQTMGRVLNSTLDPRRGTPLDASLCDHVVMAWMKGAAEAGGTTNPWSTVRIIRDIRSAKVALDDGEYTSTEIQISLGEGARTGTLRILHPIAAPSGGAGGVGSAGAAGHPALLALEAEIQATLFQTKVPLNWLQGLKPGDLLEMPKKSIDHVRIETLDGKRLVRARLGCMGKKRAVRILDEDDPDTPANAPAALQGLAAAGAADLPEIGLAPGPTGLPDLPDLDPVGDLPDPGGLPALPDLPDPAPLGELPDLPMAEPMGGLPDLPDLEPLGELPDLPAIED